MDNISALLIGLITSGAFTSITQYVLERQRNKEDYVTKTELKSMQTQIDALSEGLKAMLSDRLEHLISKYKDADEISTTQYKSLVVMHNAYKQVGGNSFIDEGFEGVTEKYKNQF